jgi:hypothetical protein
MTRKKCIGYPIYGYSMRGVWFSSAQQQMKGLELELELELGEEGFVSRKGGINLSKDEPKVLQESLCNPVV